MANKLETATLGAGCFWCTEAIFQNLKGVESVTPGYAGGEKDNPSYEDVSTGETGYVEVAQIKFDPDVISYQKILEVFWHVHDPTTMNRQGSDSGTQYASVIFYHNDQQKEIAQQSKLATDAAHLYSKLIITRIEPFKNFFEAEEYHKNYYNKNKTAGYCSLVIAPKLKHFKEDYKDWLKPTTE
jgi:peptide-methionine (S)-S-oxide reductase